MNGGIMAASMATLCVLLCGMHFATAGPTNGKLDDRPKITDEVPLPLHPFAYLDEYSEDFAAVKAEEKMETVETENVNIVLEYDSREKPPKCNPAEYVKNIEDFTDLVNWVKIGKPAVNCSYEDGVLLFDSVYRIVDSSRAQSWKNMDAIPFDDGFTYHFMKQPKSNVSVLVRRPKLEDDLTEQKDVYHKMFLPDLGIAVLSQYNADYKKFPIHGLDGYYGYDHFDEEYYSPTGTNAEEDLVFNVTIASTVMDLMLSLFPELIEEECREDELLDYDDQIARNRGRNDYYESGRPVPTHRPNLPNILNRPHGPVRNRRPVHVVKPPRRQNDRYPNFHRISKSLLIPYSELEDKIPVKEGESKSSSSERGLDSSAKEALLPSRNSAIFPPLYRGVYSRHQKNPTREPTSSGRSSSANEVLKGIDFLI